MIELKIKLLFISNIIFLYLTELLNKLAGKIIEQTNKNTEYIDKMLGDE